MSYSEQMLTKLQEDHDWPSAKKLFALALRHDDDDTLYDLGTQLYQLGFNPQAKRIFEKLLRAHPTEDELRTYLADIAVSAGDNDAALNYLDAIQPTSDDYVAGLMTSADVYQAMGIPEVSEQKLKEAKRQAPDEPIVDFALAELYFSLGRFQEALPYYQNVRAAGEEEVAKVVIGQRIGATLAGMGEYEEAISEYQKLPREAMDADTTYQLGVLYVETKQYQQAVDTLTALQQSDPDYAGLYPYLAKAQAALNQLADALSTVQIGLGFDEFNTNLYHQGFDYATRLDDEDHALEFAQEALAQDPDDQDMILSLSNLYVKNGDDQANIDLITTAAQNHELDPQMYWNIARSYERQDRMTDARENFLLAYPHFRENADFMHDLVLFFQSIAARKELLAALKQYLKLVPDDMAMQAAYDELLAEP
ncbi:MAG: tetratricopeptide repeat protein [Schleiferilactobacillus harbinensis]|jgi:predicted Zn-dependent protease|nr:tetratricopeptide repeat protein [Schleiferilactobacillus harbinensis]MCI1912454.1 tetratricopeptide repeat protein [Schleiferilactobacillus harbinensis]